MISCSLLAQEVWGLGIPTDDDTHKLLKLAYCQAHALFNQMLSSSDQKLNMSDVKEERLSLTQGFQYLVSSVPGHW